MGTITLATQAAPGTPATATVVVYAKSDGLLYWKDAVGTEYPMLIVATQAQQETGASLVVAVTPGRQQFNPSAAKGWIECGVAADIQASYNVTSITDDGAGVVTITWNVDFSTGSFCVVTGYVGGFRRFIAASTGTAGSTQLVSRDEAGTNTDPTNYFAAAFGDQ